MKRHLSGAAVALASVIATSAVAVTAAEAKDPLAPRPSNTARHDRQYVYAPSTPMPVYSPNTPGPVSSAPQTVTVVEQPVQPVGDGRYYIVTREHRPVGGVVYRPVLVPRGSAAVATEPGAGSRTYYMYGSPEELYGGAAGPDAIEPAVGPQVVTGSPPVAAIHEFERMDADEDGSISGQEYFRYAERYGKPHYWNY